MQTASRCIHVARRSTLERGEPGEGCSVIGGERCGPNSAAEASKSVHSGACSTYSLASLLKFIYPVYLLSCRCATPSLSRWAARSGKSVASEGTKSHTTSSACCFGSCWLRLLLETVDLHDLVAWNYPNFCPPKQAG